MVAVTPIKCSMLSTPPPLSQGTMLCLAILVRPSSHHCLDVGWASFRQLTLFSFKTVGLGAYPPLKPIPKGSRLTGSGRKYQRLDSIVQARRHGNITIPAYASQYDKISTSKGHALSDCCSHNLIHSHPGLAVKFVASVSVASVALPPPLSLSLHISRLSRSTRLITAATSSSLPTTSSTPWLT